MHAINNHELAFEADEAVLHFYNVYFNKKLTLTRVSAAIESVTVSKEVAAGIRKGTYTSRI